MERGTFVISLDFELLWGVQETQSEDTYGKNIRGVWEAVPAMLELFDSYDVKATFSTVGSLFCEDFDDLKKSLPASVPQYENEGLNPFEWLKNEEKIDPRFFFALPLIQQIAKNHEVGTHTFSHYYCLEKGQDENHFRNDLIAAKKVALRNGIEVKSIVFPRNQTNDSYLKVCAEAGLTSYRGNEESSIYEARSRTKETLTRRMKRLVDTYVNISGHHTHSYEYISSFNPMNLASSRFLRPYNSSLSILEPLKIRRIKNSMTHAAKNGEVFHLWWHPHNFGKNLELNCRNLEKILQHFTWLKSHHDFDSKTMTQLTNQVLAQK